jgi:uncharacterized protein (DUF2236 family)
MVHRADDTLGAVRTDPLTLPKAGTRPLPTAAEAAHGFFGPDSIVWRVSRENVLLLGGPAAVLLQLAHPAVAAGVAQHSRFGADPLARFRRTFEIVDRILFGNAEEALVAARAARRRHDCVRGRLPEDLGPHRRGTPYYANRPDLLLWVHATLIEGALDGYARFVGPLREAERERYYRETMPFAQLFGIPAAALPGSYDSFRAYFAHTIEHVLAVGTDARELRRRLRESVPRALLPLTALLAAGMLPDRVRELYELPWSRARALELEVVSRGLRRALPHLPDRVRYDAHYLRATLRSCPASSSAPS